MLAAHMPSKKMQDFMWDLEEIMEESDIDGELNETYRPTGLDDCIGQKHIIPKLKEQVRRIQQGNDGEMPHLFFSGPPGIGKTSTAVAFLKDCFGDAWEENTLITNASDERKLEDIRTKVKAFAELSESGTYFDNDGIERPIPFKTVILDEADYLDSLAQPPLRRIMEEYSHNTRFIIVCNYPHKIISPIRDRCVTFRFKPLSGNDVNAMIDKLIVNNGIDIDEKARQTLGEYAQGSARKAQNILYSASLNGKKVGSKEIIMASGLVSKQFPKQVFMHMLDKTVGYQEKFDLIDNNVDMLIDDGASAEEIVEVFYEYISELKNVPPSKKGELFYMLGETAYRCTQVENQPLQVKIFLRQLIGVIS